MDAEQRAREIVGKWWNSLAFPEGTSPGRISVAEASDITEAIAAALREAREQGYQEWQDIVLSQQEEITKLAIDAGMADDLRTYLAAAQAEVARLNDSLAEFTRHNIALSNLADMLRREANEARAALAPRDAAGG